MSDLTVKLAVVSIYLAVMVAVGGYGFRLTGRDPVSYFLANRGLGTLLLLFTMLATLASGFTVVGVPGDAYLHGLGVFLGVGLVDALVAGFFFLLGYRLWLASHRFDLVTPSEFFAHRFDSPFLGLLYSVTALIFTAPYISLQIIAGGLVIQGLTDGRVPYLTSAVIMAVIIMVYVGAGGMRAVALTDTIQGLIMVGGMLAAFLVLAFTLPDRVGTWSPGLDAHLAIPGPSGRWNWQGLLGFQAMILMAVPMFPQIFQRFYTARDTTALKRAMVYWPLLVTALFFPAVLIGVWGVAAFPELTQADAVMSRMIDAFLPSGVAAVVITALVAALMSTADSQLLTSSSLFTRDIYARYINPGADERQQDRVGRWSVFVIGITSFAIAINPPGLIVAIGQWTFQGLGMLFPLLLAGLYWKRCSRAGAVTGGCISSGLTIGWLTGLLPASWTMGWLPVIPAVAAGSVAMVLVSLLTRPDGERVRTYFQDLWEVEGS